MIPLQWYKLCSSAVELVRRAQSVGQLSDANLNGSLLLAVWPDARFGEVALVWKVSDGDLVGLTVQGERLCPPQDMLEIAVDIGEPADPRTYTRDRLTGVWWANGSNEKMIAKLDREGLDCSSRILDRLISMPLAAQFLVAGAWPTDGKVRVIALELRQSAFREFDVELGGCVDDLFWALGRFSLDPL